MTVAPFRVKIHEENVHYYIRRIAITSLARVDFTIIHDKVVKSKYSVFRQYQGRVYIRRETIMSAKKAESLERAALKNGRDVITMLEQGGDMIEYLDEPGLIGKKIITPHVDNNGCGFGLCDEDGWRDAVRCDDVVYVGYRAKYLQVNET